MPLPAQKGVFLTIEGVEGVGKSTALKFISDYLKQANIAFAATREPGGTTVAEQIRQVLLTPQEEKLTSDAELLLMFAARAQNVTHLIQPALEAGQWVVCDRYVDASYAYQGGGRGLPLAQIESLDKWIVSTCQPHKTILLDASPQIGLARAKKRGQKDRIEQEELDFFEKVRSAYLTRAAHEPERFCVIDATQPLPQVQANIKALLDQLILDLHGKS